MNLSQLPKTTSRSLKRVGRGYGSGRGGHTSGRGHKGQKARGDVKLIFEGTKMKKSLLKRLPFQRGKAKMKSLKTDPVVLHLHDRESFKGDQVTVDQLVKQGIVEKEAKLRGVKVLSDGSIKKALTFKIPVSASAGPKITKAGGKIEL